MDKCRAVALALFAALCFGQFAAAQANVNEGLELFSFWVDTKRGSDSNPGTQALPFKTIGWAASQAVLNNQASKGTHVWINDGTYRETITLTASSLDTSLPMTFEAVNHGKVIVSGGVIYTGWSVYTGNSSIYTHAWNNKWGLCATVTGCSTSIYPQPNIMLRQEMVAVNGTELTEVLSVAQMQPGTFFVDTTAALIYVWPATGTNMTTATVDVATQPTLFAIAGKSNIVIRGIVFQYANSCRSNSAVAVSSGGGQSPSNILFDSDTFQWNNGQGLAIDNPATLFTVENSSSLHNGDSGLQSYNTQFGLWQNDTVAFNNWRGAQGAYYACNVAGFHSWEAHDDSLSGFTAKYNQTYGIHWDTDNVRITGSGIVASQNLVPGLFSEVNPGPISINSSYVCNQSSSLSGGGFAIRNSEGISLTNSVVYNNTAAELAVIGTPGGIQITDWLTGASFNLISQGMTNTGNVIEGVGSSQLLFSDPTLNGLDWTTFLLGFSSNNNTWWNASNSSTEFQVPVPTTQTSESFAGWQATTLQDLTSTFAAPTGNPENGCAVTADVNDYWLYADSPTVTANDAGQATFTLTVSPLLNFAGTVSFKLDGITEVAGLSATNPTSVTKSGTTQLVVKNTTSTKTGTYPITVIGTSGNQTRTVTVNVVIPVTQVRLSTPLLTFASQTVNTTSPGQSFTIQNFGRTALSITSITASKYYAISANTCGASLAAGTTCKVTVTFTPTLVGTVTGTVTIVDGDATSPQTVSLTGTGVGAPVVTLSPTSLSFGAVLVKSSSVPQTVTVTNTGGSTLTFGTKGIAITGTNIADFSQTNNCGTSVAVGASCTITVTFTPQASGSRSASVTLTDNASNGTQTVGLSGSGAYPTVTLTPSTLAFGNIEVGYSSSSLPSTLKNSGQVTLTITNIALSGLHPTEYTQTNNCIGSFAPGATCTINATFSPTAAGAQNASITITDNTSALSNTLTLTGSGAQPTATIVPASDNFGSITVGTTSTAKVSTLTNNSAYLLQINSITISGANASDYAKTTTCPVGSTLAAHATCTISVTFTPSATGTRTATVTESDNSAAATHTITLSGTGK
jgi:hypothetical protein